MNTTELDPTRSLLRRGLDADGQMTGHRKHVLGILIVALVISELVKDVAFSTDRGEWRPVYEFFVCAVIAGLPFLLARMAPKVAGFEVQWLPDSRRHWAWFAGMVFLLFLLKAFLAALAVAAMGGFPPRPVSGPVTPTGIIFSGIAVIVAFPIAEEIFFRGYVLDQLRKLTHSGVALVIQALLFGLYHLYARGLFTSHAWFASIVAFSFGLILGVWRIKLKSLLPLILAHALCNTTYVIPLKTLYDHVTAKSDPIRHTVSEETTGITEPLRPDGSVDYVAALNERQRQGVTTRNNAAVLFWKAVGPGEILPEYRTKYFSMLGIWQLREKGDYFVNLDSFVDRRLSLAEASDGAARYAAADRLRTATGRPWSPQEFPLLAEWLAANEKPLTLLVEASKRPRRYDPLCCPVRAALIAVPFPANMIYREVAQAFCARATLRLGEGKPEEAWEDLLTCHRLARLAGQVPTAVQALRAFADDGTACDGDLALLQQARLSAAQIATMRHDLDQLPPLPTMVDHLDAAERFTYLDTVSDYSRHGMKSVTEFFNGMMQFTDGEYDELESTVNALIYYGDSTAIDWDLILRMGNSWYDRIVEAYRKPTVAEQRKALREIEEDLSRLKKTAANAESLEKLMLDGPREALSERLGQILLTFYVSTPTHFLQVENRATMRFELNKLGFALAAYHAAHGSYPARLADLVPDDVAELPNDVFSGFSLRYRRQGKGYLLYSVGVNGKSDGARGYEDQRNLEDWDDLVIRVPASRAAGQKR